MKKDAIAQLVEFANETKYREIPKEVVDFAKGLTLKTVAGMLAGSAKPSGRKMTRLIQDRGSREDVGVIGCGFKTSLWEATYLHAFNAHASELEDDRVVGGSSWDITVIPLLFSLCEKLRLSGKALMEAIVLGMEVHARTCVFPLGHLGILYVPGAVGPAMAACKVMGLGNKEMTASIGLALSNAPLSFTNFGTDGHYFESSIQCLQALIAAEMAKEGMYGNPDLTGFMSGILGKDKVNPERMVEGLGEKWLFCETWIKKYPLCLIQHRFVDVILELRKKHNISYEEVETIEAHLAPGGELCDRPEPKTEGDLQFSYQHSLGTALLDGEINLSHLDTEAIDDPRFKKARSKVKVVMHPEWPRGVGGGTMNAAPARVIVKMKDGKEFSGERKCLIGSPEEPLTMGQFKDLYSKFTRDVLSESLIKETMERILNLEIFSDTEELMHMLVYRHRI